MSLQSPQIPIPNAAIEIDAVIFDIQMKLSTNLTWLSNSYGRAYRHIQQKESIMYFPEVYKGTVTDTPSYHRVTPDSKEMGSCFFVVAKERQKNFIPNQANFLTHKVGIVFWANLDLIDKASLDTELITQKLISEARSVLTNTITGSGYRIEIDSICREFNEIFAEFTVDEKEGYLEAPYQMFRVNLEVCYQEECQAVPFDRCEAIRRNITIEEGLCLLPEFDFGDPIVFNTLTVAQKAVLTSLLCP